MSNYFGLVVDGAVIIVESIIFHVVHTNSLQKNETMNEIAEHSASQMMRSALFGQLIILIVYFPILSLTGIEGKMFRPMAMAVSFAIIGAMILCVTYVPMASALLINKNIKEEGTLSSRIMGFLYRIYHPVIRLALRKRVAVLVMAVVLFAGSLLLFLNMGGEFIPQLDEGDFAIETRLAPGSSLTQTIQISTQAEKILLQFPEVKEVISKIGTAEIPTDPMPLEANDLMVILKDKDEWITAATKSELAEKMSAKLEAIPGVNFDFQQPIQMRFNELMTGVKSDIAIKIYGEDLNTLFHMANQSAAAIRNIPGVADIKVEQIVGLPQMLVSYNRDKIAQYGVNIADLNTILKTSFAGEAASVVFEGEKRFDLVVRLDSSFRTDIQNIRDLYVNLPNGNKIPFQELATISYKEAPMQISRDNAKRRITIGVNVRNRDVESLVNEMQQVLGNNIQLPPGYYFTFGGQFENLQKAKIRLGIAVPVSLLLIFILLYFTFHSLKQSLMIFTAIPLSAIGGVLALWVRGMPFSISAGVGFIALFGVAVLNGIVLISYFNDLEKQGMSNVFQRILKGTSVRFRPVIMTASVASLGFLPMALSGSAGAEVQKPLATVVIGGLISATLLTLVVLPVLYSFFSKSKHDAECPKPELNGKTGNMGLVVLLLLGISAGTSKAQAQPALPIENTENTEAVTTLTLAEAIDAGLRQNQLIKAYNLDIAVQQRLVKTAATIPKTNFDMQYGQTQMTPIDYSYSVIQETAFPTLYVAQRRLAQSQVGVSQKQYAIQKNELIKNIQSVYYHLLYNHQLINLLLQQDSLYTRAAQAASVRFRTGATNQLEKVSAEARAQELTNRLALIQTDLRIAQQQLGILLNTAPVRADTTMAFKKEVNSQILALTALQNNPLIDLYQQQVAVKEQQIRVEKQHLLPDLRVGYLSQSIERIQGFDVFQAGISVPIFFSSQRNRIVAAGLNKEVSEAQLAYYTTQVNGEFNRLLQEYAKLSASLNYYEQYALPQAAAILENAEKTYRLGEIEYTGFVQNTLQAWQIHENYLNQVSAYNQVLIQLEALTGAAQ